VSNRVRVSMNLRTLSAAVGIWAVLVTFAIARADEPSPDQAAIAASSNQFGLDLYQQVRQGRGNLFLSPFSIDTALLMVHAGAAGKTAADMATALHLPEMSADALQAAVAKMIGGLQADPAGKKYQLQVANAIWGQKGFAFLPSYTDSLRKYYAAELNTADFADAAASAGAINDWVAKKTSDRIKDLISPGSLTAATRLVLVNAIYFKGDWKSPFKVSATSEGPWHISEIETRSETVPTMRQNGTFDYFQDENLSALQMNYAGDDLAMLVLLPAKIEGIGDLEAGLTADRLDGIVKQLHQEEVVVSLPKFKLESQFDLARTLAAMGMGTAFDTTADFSGMDGRRDLLISDVVHKAFVQVDEKGTEAAAATGVTMRAMAVREPTRFTADHPFLFLIRDLHTGAILFIGRLEEPTT
jgi:serpin B